VSNHFNISRQILVIKEVIPSFEHKFNQAFPNRDFFSLSIVWFLEDNNSFLISFGYLNYGFQCKRGGISVRGNEKEL
jgi:hypothetical protein